LSREQQRPLGGRPRSEPYQLRGDDNPGAMAAEIRDVAPGLWLWRTPHPGWTPDSDFDGPVTSICAAADGEVVVLDPLAPEPDCAAWARFDAEPPTVAVVLKPDHVRDVDVFIRRYGARGFGPLLFYPDDVPRSRLAPIEPGSVIPGGLLA